MSKVINFTEKMNERELQKIPHSKTKEQLLKEVIEFIDEQNEEETLLANDEEFFEFLVLVKTELHFLKEKNVVSDYSISTEGKGITVNVVPSMPIDRIDLKVIVSNKEYD